MIIRPNWRFFPEEPSRTFLLSSPESPVTSQDLEGSTAWFLATVGVPPFVMGIIKKPSGVKITRGQHQQSEPRGSISSFQTSGSIEGASTTLASLKLSWNATVQEVQTLQLWEEIHHLHQDLLRCPWKIFKLYRNSWAAWLDKNSAQGPRRVVPGSDLSPQLQLPGQQVSGAVTTSRNKERSPSLLHSPAQVCRLAMRPVGQVGSLTHSHFLQCRWEDTFTC